MGGMSEHIVLRLNESVGACHNMLCSNLRM